jgi:hypothetical protein
LIFLPEIFLPVCLGCIHLVVGRFMWSVHRGLTVCERRRMIRNTCTLEFPVMCTSRPTVGFANSAAIGVRVIGIIGVSEETVRL